ncbi:hypothetical protein GCM10010182_19010 [Actinomadura cremea]|nr:hypothetical protein GCM10010182_19010 [Actinomadura cremea]
MFRGEWLRTGDTYVVDGDGCYTCLGRTGDMLKASGIWVSPAEAEDRMLAHPAVEQAVVVGATDRKGPPGGAPRARRGCPVRPGTGGRTVMTVVRSAAAG